MRVQIQPGRASGRIAAPPSKSMAHRLLIGAGLSDGVSHISGVSRNEDIAATIDCLRAIGVSCTEEGNTVTVRGVSPAACLPTQPLCCRESGSTLRFLVPLLLLCGKTAVFTGSQTLMHRPLHVYADLCRQRGLLFSPQADRLEVCGPLTAGEFQLPGDVSSQFVSGLLFALPLLGQDSVIRLTPPVESRSYIDLTLSALSVFGVRAEWQDPRTLTVRGGQRYTAADRTVEGDYSGAAFFAALNTLGGQVEITGLSPDSLQGDRVYVQHLRALDADTPTISLADCPDLGPVLFAVAAAKHGGVFTDTRRLKIKESDRAAAMAQELQKCGACVTVREDTVEISPGALHAPLSPLRGHNDHRIVMSLAVLLTQTGGEIDGAQAVRKSFPDFFDKLAAAGIAVNEVSHSD